MTGDYTLGIDVGGTFTDVVLTADTGSRLAKVLTTSPDPTDGVIDGVRQVLAGTDVHVSRVVHGTTLATNLILERRGADVVAVTTQGFANLLRLGRPARVEEDRFNLHFVHPPSPLSSMRIVEAGERMLASGVALVEPSDAEITRVATTVAALEPEAVAVCLLHSYANPAHERRVVEAIRDRIDGVFIAASADVWPELREYDRAVTTALSAYVGPAVAGYIDRLAARLAGAGVTADVAIMDSAGGVVTPSAAVRRPVRILESGGAAGMRAAASIAATATKGAALSFDMGGTTAKAGVITDGEPGITHQFQVGGRGSYGYARAGTGLPVKGPVVDLAEIGAGGGSIARVDSAGSLLVGPESAGSHPGPASYGLGGVEATVTDANVALGVLPEAALAPGVVLSRAAACDAIERAVASPLGLDVVDAAAAIREIAVAQMAAAIRMVTTQRGVDPRAFPIVAFGGAAPMHAIAIADAFGIDRLVIPWGAGLGSAFGLAAAPVSADRVRTHPMPAAATSATAAQAVLRELAAEAADELGVDVEAAEISAALDMRYVGQAHELAVPAGDFDDRRWIGHLTHRFRDLYRQSYGVDLDAPSEIVSFRVRLTLGQPATVWSPRPGHDGRPSPTSTRHVHFGRGDRWRDVAEWPWEELPVGWGIVGPAVIAGCGTTVLVEPGWSVEVDRYGHLDLRRTEADPPPAAQVGGIHPT
jgi:N-methylhydantoinase A